MSRIAGFHRLIDPRLSVDERMLHRMLLCYPGAMQILKGPHAMLGRVTPPGARIGGGTADAAGVQVVLDGRILNAADLRSTMPPVAPGDAALIAALVRRHGMAGALARLEGDFAIAVVDTAAGRLWLARDRFGVKPLYWTAVSGGVGFASQPRSLLRLPEVAVEPDPSFVARFAGSHYRTFDNDPESSPYRNIRQVPAASVLEIHGRTPGSPRAYWRLEEQSDIAAPEAELAEVYRHKLFGSVQRRLKTGCRPVFTLSGGLDSSSILCSAVALSGKRQHAVSCVYSDHIYDERDEIGDVVADKVSTWHSIEIGNQIDIASIVARQVRLHDEPVATATWLSHLLLVERMVEEGFDALFGGLGGDELNAGEYEYFPMHFADLRASGDERELAHEIECWATRHDHPVHRKDLSRGKAMMERLSDPAVPGLCRPDRARMLRYAGVLRRDYFDLESFTPMMDRPFRSYLKNRAFQDTFRETLPCCLRAQDRHCGGVGIESFNPFLDHTLAEFMFRVPGTLKIRHGITKRLLREAMTGILPEATRTRVKKTGWNAPAHMWFSDRVLDHLRDRVSSAAFRERGIYDPAAVMSVIDDHVRIVTTPTQEENHMMFLWQLLNLDTWLDALPDISGDKGVTLGIDGARSMIVQ